MAVFVPEKLQIYCYAPAAVKRFVFVIGSRHAVYTADAGAEPFRRHKVISYILEQKQRYNDLSSVTADNIISYTGIYKKGKTYFFIHRVCRQIGKDLRVVIFISPNSRNLHDDWPVI
jgi:hypothetical protein